jgi:hypothetical protein
MEKMEEVAVQRDLLPTNAPEEQKELVLEKHSIGMIFKNEKPSDATLSDLVCGQQISNAAVLDLSSLQNLFFTLILVGSYGAALGSYLVSQSSTKSPLHEFPTLADSSIALLIISHAGYLASKAINK